MEDGKEEYKWAYGYGKPIPKEYIIEYKKGETQFLGILFTLKDGSTMFVENKNSMDLEDKSNGE